MKKFFAGVVKFLVVLSVIAGLGCAVIRYWDRIMELVGRVKTLVHSRGGCCASTEDDYADYADCADYADWAD